MAANNNNPANDTINERIGRLASVNANLAAYAAELELEAELVAQLVGGLAAYEAALAEQEGEHGEATIASGETEARFTALRKQYVLIKEYLANKIISKHAPARTAVEFGIVGPTPTSYAGLIRKVNTLQRAQTKYVAAGKPYVAKTAAMTTLAALETSFKEAYQTIDEEHTEAYVTTADANEIFAEHTQLFRDLLQEAKQVWPGNSPKYYAIGLVPPDFESEGGGEDAIEDFTFDEPTTTFNWTGGEGKVKILRYRPAAGGTYTVVAEDTIDHYTWMPPSGDWVFELGIVPEGGGEPSVWATLALTIP